MNPHIRLKTVSVVYKERKLKYSDSKVKNKQKTVWQKS